MSFDNAKSAEFETKEQADAYLEEHEEINISPLQLVPVLEAANEGNVATIQAKKNEFDNMSFDTMNQGISDQLSDIQQNIHRTYMTYDAKLQSSKEKGLDKLNDQLARARKVMDDKVKWGISSMEKKTHDLMQKTVEALDTKVQQSEGTVSTFVDNLSKRLERMEVSTLEICRKHKDSTSKSCLSHLDQLKSQVLHEIQDNFKICDTKIKEKMKAVESTYKSYQSRVEELVDTNLQDVLDTTHDCNAEIRSLAASLNRDSSGQMTTGEINVELKLQQLSDKHAQRIARITDDSDARIKASIEEMSSKYELYTRGMSRQKRELDDMISAFQSKQEQQQVQISNMLHAHTEEVEKSMVEVRQYHTTILE